MYEMMGRLGEVQGRRFRKCIDEIVLVGIYIYIAMTRTRGNVLYTYVFAFSKSFLQLDGFLQN